MHILTCIHAEVSLLLSGFFATGEGRSIADSASPLFIAFIIKVVSSMELGFKVCDCALLVTIYTGHKLSTLNFWLLESYMMDGLVSGCFDAWIDGCMGGWVDG